MFRSVAMVAILFWIYCPYLTAEEDNHDRLPLGPSTHRYELGKVEANQIIRTDSGTVVDMDHLTDQALESDVIILGEFHDSYECHVFQREFIGKLFEKYPRIIVGFEFFTREDNPVLQRWRTGSIDEKELIRETGWYAKTALNYGYTRLVMEMIQRHRIPVVGLNVPRTLLRTVSRKGFDALSDTEKGLFPTINVPNPEHRFLIQRVFGNMAVQVPMWFENIYSAQVCWDVVMAESMRAELALPERNGYKGVIIAGSLHVAYSLGIPFRYALADSEARISTIVPVLLKSADDTDDPDQHPMMKAMASGMKPAVVFSRGLADYVIAVPGADRPYYPVLGVRGTFKEDRYVVDAVLDDSVASQHGLSKGDAIVAIDGEPLTSQERFRLLLAEKKWGDPLRLTVEKSILLEKKAHE